MARALAVVISLVEVKTCSGVGLSWLFEPRRVVSGLTRQPIGRYAEPVVVQEREGDCAIRGCRAVEAENVAGDASDGVGRGHLRAFLGVRVDDANAGDAYGGLVPFGDVSGVACGWVPRTMTGWLLAAWASRSIRRKSLSEHGPLTWISSASAASLVDKI